MKRIHFVGIGGAGMSGLAKIFHAHGFMVHGSDIRRTKLTDRLERVGIHVKVPHSAENIKDIDYVVYSSCIKKDNVELKEASRRNIPILRRIEALNMLTKDKSIVAVSGAHGKTTTTALLSYLLIEAGLDPTVLIGGDVFFLGGNARYGKSDIVVTEADESDGSFLLLHPLYSVCTNVDKEHMDYYSSMDNVIESYRKFIENTKDEGLAFLCNDDCYLHLLSKDTHKRVVRYGLSLDADIRADNIELLGLGGSRFDFVFRNKVLGRVVLSLVGRHNVLNSLPAIGIAMDLGIDFLFIKKVISGFKGVDRRFIVSRLDSDILIIDDYAHHPTEIEATLRSIEGSGRRVIAVFQPHRYSRTKYLREEFGRCFDLADYVIITDIYSADENPIDGVNAQDLCESTKRWGHRKVHFVAKCDIIKHLMDVVKPTDAVFILGAGDIGELPEKLIRAFENVETWT